MLVLSAAVGAGIDCEGNSAVAGNVSGDGDFGQLSAEVLEVLLLRTDL